MAIEKFIRRLAWEHFTDKLFICVDLQSGRWDKFFICVDLHPSMFYFWGGVFKRSEKDLLDFPALLF